MENAFVVPMGGTVAGTTGCELVSLLPRLADAALAEMLQDSYPEGMCYAWGVRDTPENRLLWDAMAAGDLVLCYSDRSIVSASYVIAKTIDPVLATGLWGGDVKEPCSLLCFTDRPRTGRVPIVPQMFRYLDADYGGVAKLPPEKVKNILNDYGSSETFVSLCLQLGFPFSLRHSQD